MSEYFLERKSSRERVKVELDFSYYATRSYLKNAAGADTSKFVKKVDLAHLKTNADKLDIDKLKNVLTNLSNFESEIDQLDFDKLVPFPVDLSKLSDVVKNDVVKKDVYNTKIKNIEDKILDITNVTTNTSLNAKTNKVKKEIPSISNLATTTALNAKINEVKTKIPNITNLAITAALKITKVINSVKNTDYNTNISENENTITTDNDHDKHITTQVNSRKFYCKTQTNKFSKQK